MGEEISRAGWIGGVIAWIGIIILTSRSAACARFSHCGSEDLAVFAVLAMGMFVPAFICAIIVDCFFGALGRRRRDRDDG